MPKLNKAVTFIIALCMGLSAGYLSYTQLLYIPDQAFTNWIYDHAIANSLDTRITIIAIDEKSEAVYGEYKDWSRALLADAVEELSAQGAAVIGLDVNLALESTDTDGDMALAEACKASGNVVTIANALYEDFYQHLELSIPQQMSGTDSEQFEEALDAAIRSQISYAGSDTEWTDQKISAIINPYDELYGNVRVGIANAAQESSDGLIRNAALAVAYQNGIYDSFAVAVYKEFQDSLGNSYTLPKLDADGLFGFNMLSSQLTNNIVSFSDLLTENYDASLIDGSIVLIGEYDESLINAFESFINPSRKQQDVLLQAAILQTLLNQRSIANVDPKIQALLFCMVIMIFYMIIASKKIWVTIVAQIMMSLAVGNIGYISNLLGYRFQLLIPALFFLMTIMLSLLQRSIVSAIERKKMELTMKMYVEPEVVDQIITTNSPRELARLNERKHIAVLFVDIRGFTTISESLEPEQVVDILNEYLGLVAKAIAYWDGTLDKFIGDAAMAIFNAPGDLDNYVLRAVCAADAIAHSSDYIREKYEKRYGKTVSFGIGVNCGEAIVGNIGSFSRMDYTAIGDTVNTASRLEANARAGQILVSEEVYETVKDYVDATHIGPLSLKGKTHTVETYQIDAITDLPKHLLPKEGFFFDKFILHPKTKPAR